LGSLPARKWIKEFERQVEEAGKMDSEYTKAVKELQEAVREKPVPG